MHPQRITVWCGFWSGGIFSKWARSRGYSNDERYRDMLNELFPKIEEDDMDDIWFQQDGATCHTAKVTLELLATVLKTE